MKRSAHTLEELYRLHAPAAFRRARRMLGDESEAHEVVHDVFVALLGAEDPHAGRSSLSTFFYSAVTHACLNRIRNRRTRERLLEHAIVPLGTAEPIDAERRLQLHSAMRDLPELLAQVAVYYYMDELTQDEIAQILGYPRRQIGKLLARLARHMLQQESSACS